ncbi:hypothetical protein C8E03_108121 [Lachnotalea glycerini]|uniref:Uncharacterized protein n=1 Tax=Lachnotalea glycerini TaxID=1763509 RepID=A0A318EUD9_9FIRM|nr:hypothetical protein [Lachnotalea glycerini]OYP20995.1 hypothetical protein CG709_08130 [Lachnotalea glycerini]PXV88394.1 hypothetical protein C8E03_108121 [Lachnotalea glycerini]
MKINISMELPIKAIPIDKHYDLELKEYDVTDIRMGQSHTSIFLDGQSNIFNSVHFRFELHGKPIDIYSSGAFNSYRRFYLPFICYGEEK